jgi:hypothetical protein
MTNTAHDGAAVMHTMPLGAQWPIIDPFLFCAHHLDHYPAGNGSLAPSASLDGRDIGSDFSGIDGWSMYHGSSIPGFPQHPHRGFETITYVRNGLIDHADSLGATARFGKGDTQWLTAGGGIVHSEMFPMVHTDRGNPLELFQIWLNLPASRKLVEPYFTMRWAEQLTVVALPRAEVAVVVGAFGSHHGAASPPDSWAADDSHDVALWHISLPAGGSIALPPARHDEVVRVLYFFEGDALTVDGTALPPSTGAVIDCSRELHVAAPGAAELLVLQGQPIGEQVARYGPFVMNTEDQIRDAFRDYQRTGFGGWPWPADGPVHDAGTPRFAVHPDGRREQPVNEPAAPTGG